MTKTCFYKMKISNETKIGALTSIAIVFLILGFNFLKGKSFASKTLHFYAQFDNIQGLANSNPIVISGKQVGTVSSSDGGRNMRKIIVTMNMNQALDIPDNSVAIITPSIIGTTSIEIKLGNSTTFYKDGDTISTKAGAGMFDETLQKIDPVLFAVKNAVGSLDSVLLAVNSIFDAATKNNIKATMENLNKTTASLRQLLDSETGVVAKTLNNLSSFIGGLAKNNDKIDSTLNNLDKTTANLVNLDLQGTLSTLNGTINSLKIAMDKINSENGTLGKLVNNASLYNNLNATSNKINLLLDDIRVHPKRYVSISVFGKKSVEAPLTVPTPDTVNAPYTH
jgi:phospholipid/cholesterol/gamma-HCH transport system substrate-binding protein